MLQNIKTFLGPTLGKDEQTLVMYPTECPIVIELRQKLQNEAKSLIEQLDKEVVSVTKNLSSQVEIVCRSIAERGVNIDISSFQRLMHEQILIYEVEENREKIRELNSLQILIENSIKADGKLHPKITDKNAVTGRVTVSNPPLQNFPSSVRASFVPKATNELFYLDFRSMEPSVFAALSKDEALIEDIQSGDLYKTITSVFFDQNTDTLKYRDDIKTLFLSTFMYGGDTTYNLQKLNLPIKKQQWQVFLEKYEVANVYKENINKQKQVTSLIGIPYDFGRAHVNVFNRFIQSEAAWIFKHVLVETMAMEEEKRFQIILPIHDALLIEAESFEMARDVAEHMKNTFNEIVDMNIAQVTVKQLDQGGTSNE